VLAGDPTLSAVSQRRTARSFLGLAEVLQTGFRRVPRKPAYREGKVEVTKLISLRRSPGFFDEFPR